MKNYRIMSLIYFALTLIGLGLSGCEKELLGATFEAEKNITGYWKVVQVMRNQEDLTQRVDLSLYRLLINEDKTYTFKDKLPFVVDSPGTFSLDDPQYPFYLVFTPNGAASSKVKLQMPVSNGKTQLSMTLSPGCKTNTYKYVFEKVQD